MRVVGGFNTNVSYRGRTFHVQTEDSGRRSPKIVTLLYEGGTILLSRKSSYEDRLDHPDLEGLVRELMEEQHRAMVGALRLGQVDESIGVEPGAGPADAAGEGPATHAGDGPASLRLSRRAGPRAGPRAATAELEFGEALISERTLDQVVLEYLQD